MSFLPSEYSGQSYGYVYTEFKVPSLERITTYIAEKRSHGETRIICAKAQRVKYMPARVKGCIVVVRTASGKAKAGKQVKCRAKVVRARAVVVFVKWCVYRCAAWQRVRGVCACAGRGSKARVARV